MCRVESCIHSEIVRHAKPTDSKRGIHKSSMQLARTPALVYAESIALLPGGSYGPQVPIGGSWPQ